MADNSKYFFRDDEIDADVGIVSNIPPDLDWAIVNVRRAAPTVQGTGTDFVDGTGYNPAAGTVYDGPVEEVHREEIPYKPDPMRVETPQITGIRKQEVSQDPQGAGAISVTFMVTDVSNAEYEVRVTRK